MNGWWKLAPVVGLGVGLIASYAAGERRDGRMSERVDNTVAAVTDNTARDRDRAERLRQVERDGSEYRTDIKNVNRALGEIKTALDRLVRPDRR